MSLAAQTREAVDEYPFLVDAIRAGVCNYTAAARFLDVSHEIDAVATALRRYGEDLPRFETAERDVRVTMRSGMTEVSDPTDAVVLVGDVGLGPDGGDRTAILVDGAIDADGFAATLERLEIADVDVEAGGFGDATAAFVVGRRDGANALRVVERSFDAVPE